MTMSRKSFGWLMAATLLAGGALGAWMGVKWKNREMERRVADAVRVERDRTGPIRAEHQALGTALEVARFQLELARIAFEVERKNFGIARDRLEQLCERARGLLERVDGRYREPFEQFLAQREEIAADLEAVDPQAAEKLRELFVKLQDALQPE